MISIGSSNASTTYTLNQFINLKSIDSITYANFAVLNRSIDHPELVYAIDNLIYSYMDELKEKQKTCTFTLEQKIQYAYKPKLLAYDVYGSTEAYFIILALNGMCNVKEFDLEEQKLYLLLPSDMNNLLSQIYNAEKQFRKLNRESQNI